MYTRYDVQTPVLTGILRLKTFDASTGNILRFKFSQNLNTINRTLLHKFLCIFVLCIYAIPIWMLSLLYAVNA